MSAANGTALRPLTPIEEKAVELAGRGIQDSAITLQTRLSAEQIATALERNAEWEKLRGAAKSTRAYVKRDAPERVDAELNPPPAAEAARTPVPVAGLLKWAEQHGTSRAKTLAARVREQLLELRALHASDSARQEAAAKVARLTAELEAAKVELREVGRSKAAPADAVATSPDRKAYLAAVRTWARANGHELSDYGQIRHDIEAAYLAATGGGS